MPKPAVLTLAAIAALTALGARAETPAGDAAQGARLFRACAACHSLAPDRNMTGPSLAGLWGRKAGTLAGFDRYSPALKAASIVWDDQSLDAWLKSPATFIADNSMTFAGIPDARQRADLIAYLKVATAAPTAGAAAKGGFQDLKKLGPNRQVRAIRACRDSYFVTTADGKTAAFWEANLRFKTDSSDTGPLAGKPIIMPAGMMGDRASVFFATSGEISPFIKRQC